MAQSIVSSAANRLGDLLIQHATFLYGVTGQVESLHTELRRMKCFLKDADARQQGDERVKNWVAEIRSLAYDAEDVIDTFILKSATREESDLQCDLQQILKRFASLFCRWIEFCKVGKEIGTIQNKIRSISSILQTYGIRNIGEEGTSSGNERQRRLRMSYPHVKEELIVGFKKDIELLVEKLVKEEEQVRVVSIAGMGGLGKTTLAKQVHNHDVVKKHFDCTAWVTLSQQFQVRDILLGILVKISSPSPQERETNEKLREEELFEKLYKILEQKRYIVVLDDIWTIEAWDSLRSAFPDGRAGSKVLLTTRNKQVAEHADPGSLHEPRFLNNEESWELLRKKAFPQDPIEGWCCTPDLEEMGKKMLVKCGGLPLAVVVLGGLLATKRSFHGWKKVSNDIFFHINKDIGVSEILDLSFQDMPYHLKPCFLYFGLFPEDYMIRCKKLIQLWIAEGFVDLGRTGREESIMEDITEEYLAELIQRCMVQVGERGSGGNVKSCRIHDVIRDRCLSKARDEDFLEVFHHRNVVTHSTSTPRRLAVSEDNLPRGKGNRHVRSLLCFSIPRDPYLLNSALEDLKLLRVLDLDSCWIEIDRLKPLGNLIHLRYLSLCLEGSLESTKFIENLPSLQSLRLRLLFGTSRGQIGNAIMPNVMSNMRQLRHLYLDNWISVRQFRMDMLNNLQTLWHINGGSWIEEGDLSKLKNLRKLGVHDIGRPGQVEAILESSPIELDHLRTLSLDQRRWDFSDLNASFPSLEPLSSCRQLSKLYLYGKIQEDLHPHHPHGFIPPNLTKLTLEFSKLEIDPMATLKTLPNLSYLHLGSHAYMGKDLVCSAKGFPQLEYLELNYLSRLEEWKVEKGAMPRLGCLFIQACMMLRTLPEGLMFIASLQKLVIREMPIKFVKRIQQNEGIEGEDYYKVQHISSVDTGIVHKAMIPPLKLVS